MVNKHLPVRPYSIAYRVPASDTEIQRVCADRGVDPHSDELHGLVSEIMDLDSDVQPSVGHVAEAGDAIVLAKNGVGTPVSESCRRRMLQIVHAAISDCGS